MTLTVGSLFAGIGGFDLGFERAGMQTAWFVEKDPFCQAVLRQHWPGVPIFDDVCTVGAHNLTPVDVLCGGFPCQDISSAGKGAGLDGERSGLWAEFARLVGELRPRYVVVENVPMLRSRGLGRVLGEMAALGYDAEWDCIPACAVGAPHKRDRIWIVAYPQRDELREQSGRRSGPNGSGEALTAVDGEARPLADAHVEPRGAWRLGNADQGQGGRDANRGRLGAHVPNADECGRHGRPGHESEAYGRPQSSDEGWWAVEPDVGRVAHGVPARVDRLRSLGNALVPQIAEELGRRIVTWYES